ncbi:hypothetical protein KDRO_F09430 [Kluyveromyces lactis]|nr:hypothetical protein KDRO_F09430 [Kluyveromyces lactis]
MQYAMLVPSRWCLLLISLICLNCNCLANAKEFQNALYQTGVKVASPVSERTFFDTVIGVILLIWYIVVILLGYSGWVEIERKFSQVKELPEEDLAKLEPVSILRPCKGVDSEMVACLESCINQDYPKHLFEVIFCVENSTDSSIAIIQKILAKYPDHNLSLLVGDKDYFGPNPKINNLSKGYRMAKYDIVWVLDSNVWCSPGTLARSVSSLTKSLDNGIRTSKPVVLTHHVPLGISINSESVSGRLDEMFLFSSHAKFYVAFNYVSIAPCVNGKSNLYRRSNLEKAVQMIGDSTRHSGMFENGNIQKFARETMHKRNDPSFFPNKITRVMFNQSNSHLITEKISGAEQNKFHAIEFFSTYIGEDNMIGTALWDMLQGRTGMTRDVVIQPLKFGSNDDSWHSYITRRVRWLRVRKYMVLAATLLEPTTESILIGTMGSFGLTRLLPGSVSFWKAFIIHMFLWCLSDWIQYRTLCQNTVNDNVMNRSSIFSDPGYTYPFFTPGLHPRSFTDWIGTWILRECLALPVWINAMCGSVIQWRNRPFRIKPDLTAEEL